MASAKTYNDQIKAANDHQTRYYNVELPKLLCTSRVVLCPCLPSRCAVVCRVPCSQVPGSGRGTDQHGVLSVGQAAAAAGGLAGRGPGPVRGLLASALGRRRRGRHLNLRIQRVRSLLPPALTRLSSCSRVGVCFVSLTVHGAAAVARPFIYDIACTLEDIQANRIEGQNPNSLFRATLPHIMSLQAVRRMLRSLSS